MKVKRKKEKPILARARRPVEAKADTPLKRIWRGFAERWRLVAAMVGALVIAGAAVGGYFWYRHDREDRAGRAYARITENAVKRAEDAFKKAGKEGRVDEKKLTAGTMKDLDAFTKKYENTDAGRAAAYELAGLYFGQGNYKEARARFEALEKTGKGLERILSSKGVADCYRALGDYKKAIAKYREVYGQAGEKFPSVPTAMALAECYRHEGNTAEALKLYRHILDYHAGSPYAMEAATEYAKLEATAEAGR